MKARVILPLIVVGLTTSIAHADSALELIPDDAAGAIIIRDLAELQKKGDKFLSATKWNMGIRPSQALHFVYQHLGIQGGVDETKPAGVILCNPEKVGVAKLSLTTLEKVIVIAIPIGDIKKLANSFSFDPKELKPKKPLPAKGRNFGSVVYLRGDHLFLGSNANAVLAVAEGKSTGKALSAARRKAFSASDIVVLLGKEAWRSIWQNDARRMAREIAKQAKTDKEYVKEFVKQLENVRFVLASFRIDDGLGFSLLTAFEKDKAKKLLQVLRGGKRSSELRALPKGNVLLAQGYKADGVRTVVLAQSLLNIFYRGYLAPNKLFSTAYQQNIVGVFTEVWQKIKGTRFAIYQNQLGKNLGLFSAVAIFDTDDSKEFISQLKQFARLADGKSLDLEDEKSPDVATIKKLVATLGSEFYRRRQSATTKLCVIGEPVLPFLDPALKSKDLEVQQRATQIQKRIVATVVQRRKEILSHNVFERLQPTIVFERKPSDVAGHKAEVARILLKDKKIAAKMKQLFGPDWSKIRLARHKGQVVAYFGSDVKLFAATLDNLAQDKPGLAGSKQFAGFQKHTDPKRHAELHLSFRLASQLVRTVQTPNELTDTFKDPKATSFALTADDDRLRLDLWFPTKEFKVLVNAFRIR